MGVTIHLSDPLASWVQTRAGAQNLSPDDFVQGIVASVREQEEHDGEWGKLNERRMALINKDYRTGLTAEEKTELEGLQKAVDRRLEARDTELLVFVKRLKKEAESWSSPHPAE